MTDLLQRIAGGPITWGVDGSPAWNCSVRGTSPVGVSPEDGTGTSLSVDAFGLTARCGR